MEIAICELLLGRKTEALGTLGVLDGASECTDSAPDSGILDFIQVCCSYSLNGPLGTVSTSECYKACCTCNNIYWDAETEASNLPVGIICLQGHASEAGDLTPGLTAMAQSWVEDVALPSFRGSSASLAPLNTWFENPQVRMYLMVRASAPFKDLRVHRLALCSLNVSASATWHESLYRLCDALADRACL